MSIPYCEVCDRLMIEEERPIYSSRSSYSSYQGTNFSERNVVGYEKYYRCPNVDNHDRILERCREQQREQEINDLRERIRNLEQK